MAPGRNAAQAIFEDIGLDFRRVQITLPGLLHVLAVPLMLTGSLRDIRVSDEPVDAVVKQKELVAHRYHLEREAAACSGAGRGAGVRTGHEALA